ncbi:MAG TPA: mechanosensitive ion channel domain-containing protein [Candidatus Sulfotelmatobacter sp.]|jgi:small-conductance mechanosensitive channel|nr:mechanosensitive ion channel domain-containing protein [Candidatus Sulfotelmatobacter sp.]
MRSKQRAALIVLVSLLVLTGAGLVVTTEWGAQTVAPGASQQKGPQSPVDLGQFRRAQALSQLAATPEEQDLARDVLRKADHEVDFAFASALYQASSQKIPSTPEIRDALDRIAKGEQEDAELTTDVARLTKQLEGTKESQKEALTQQLDLTKSRQELIEDELADAHQDLERAGGDPQSSVQRMVDEYNASEQSSGGQLDLSIVGKQASASLPASYSFISRARAWYALHSIVGRLDQEGRAATAGATTFSGRHDQLEHQLEEAQSKQSKKMKETPAGSAPGEKSAGAAPSASTQTSEAISSYKSLTALQKRLSALDNRIRNLQGLAADYAMWRASAATRRRDLTHSLLISVALMLLIGLAVLLTAYLLERMFTRVEPDQQRLLTLRSVLHIFTRAVGAILLLVIIFGVPTQLATVIALAGAGLTVAMKDFIVGFFGWFVLMGKNGIRQGDWVEINGVSGEVLEVGLFHTVVLETGNWNDAGHPTGRRVTFVNSYAIEGHYFNFSTSGQWLWDELQLAVPVDKDPYPVAEEIQKIVAKETEANSQLAEQEWGNIGGVRGIRAISAGPAINVRPAGTGFEITVRYVTRANERHRQRANLYSALVEMLRRKNIPEAVSPRPSASAAP